MNLPETQASLQRAQSQIGALRAERSEYEVLYDRAVTEPSRFDQGRVLHSKAQLDRVDSQIQGVEDRIQALQNQLPQQAEIDAARAQVLILTEQARRSQQEFTKLWQTLKAQSETAVTTARTVVKAGSLVRQAVNEARSSSE